MSESTTAATTTTTIINEPGLKHVKHVILVLSGKGGVGKSTVAVQLARCFNKSGARVGLLDIDLCGPSVPKIMGIEGTSVKTTSAGWLPVFAEAGGSGRFPVVSIGLLTDEQDAPVIWRGPKKNSIIRALVEDVCWGELDVLVIDTPPGTSDEHISAVEYLMAGDGKARVSGAVMVTTPQNISVIDVKKEISFCRKTEIPILGIVENMSGYVCPHCTTCTNVFSSEGGRILAEQSEVPFIGKLPIDPFVCECEERGLDPFAEAVKLGREMNTLKPLEDFVASFKI